MTSNDIQTVMVTDHEVSIIMESIGKATEAHSDNAAILGCLATALTLSHPSIDRDKLVEGVRMMSEYMALFLSNATKPLSIN